MLVFGSAFGAGMINSVALSVPSLAGARLLSRTPAEVFDRLVPALILFATCLPAAQEAIQRRFDLSAIHTSGRSPWLSWAMLFQVKAL